MNAPLLITGGRVVTDPSAGRVDEQDILVRDGVIAELRAGIDAPGAEIIDARDRIVIPGLIDTHKHTWQSAIRHRTTGIDLFAYFGDVFGRLGSTYTPDDVYIGTLLGALAALEAGTTTLMDWSHVQNSPEHSDAAIRALQEAGIRAVFGHGWPLVDLPRWIQGSTLNHTDDVRRIRREVLHDDQALVTLALAARGPELSTLEVTENDLAMARDLGIRTSIHMGCGKDFGAMSAIAQMNDAGLLGPDLIFVHCSESSDDELRMMADHGVSGSVAPHHEQGWPGIGHTPIDRLRGLGITTGLSTDSESFGASDLYAQMKIALAAVRARVNAGESKFEEPPSDFSVNDVLAMATSDAAEVLGLSDRTGSIAVGKAADLALVRTDDLNLHPVVEPIAAVVNAAHPGNVDTVIVGGAIRKRDGRLVGVDLDRVRELAEQSQRRILSL
ncbi:cytosine/adenosine deaminase-related metal-dependent hydrolase [Amycolatopsis bartoniae]|uniref:TRZ/ATZ family hydrolase n=1 Tax=Amycolatopsis bartoniae TaxID=941986 RepID=A0A8H9MBG0_9PSEU|nr:amidohydrolase family protein [Amycolatopsis bartoniae]MBB2940267.1 cytosine/adenosine deaminase-related metal-dependent hydrolase [Amycolatopsis bartoniae]TVT10155.1 amidohydrolase family protein [Amycolatopsis bartoniae]GHF35273.1 TRZ/ATZ family hydrolase [Amycolatopsis bartoniae]